MGESSHSAEVISAEEDWTKDTKKVSPAICTALWISLGISMIVFNKVLLSPKEQGGFGFGFPFFLMGMHMTFSTICTQLLYFFTPLLRSAKEGKISSWGVYWYRVFPLALFFSLGLVLGNSAYKYLSVSYIQMMKSSLPIPTLIVSWMIGREGASGPSNTTILLILFITFGAIVSSLGELNFNTYGFILQSLALCSDVMRMLFMDQLTLEVKLDNLSTIYYLSPISALLIGVGFVFIELPTFEYEFTSGFMLVLLCNCILAFALNLAVVLFVTNIGIVGMTLAGILKDVSVVVLGVVLFGRYSHVSTQQVLGFSCSLSGLIAYKEYRKNSAFFEECKETLAKYQDKLDRTFGWSVCGICYELFNKVKALVDYILCCFKIGQGQGRREAEERMRQMEMGGMLTSASSSSNSSNSNSPKNNRNNTAQRHKGEYMAANASEETDDVEDEVRL